MTPTPPLTDDDIAQIRARHRIITECGSPASLAEIDITALLGDVSRLLAEVDRLNECLRPGSSTERAPTTWAYGQACAAIENHRQRATQAEAERDAAKARAEASAKALADAREAFLSIVTDAKEFDENYDGDADGDGRLVTTLDYSIRHFPAYALKDLCEAFGIRAAPHETLMAAILRTLEES